MSVNWVKLGVRAWTKDVEGHYQTGSETSRSLVWMRNGRGEEFSWDGNELEVLVRHQN